MKKYILFGAGKYAKKAINIIGAENIVFIVDNDKAKNGVMLEEIPIFSYEDKKYELINYEIVISVSEKYTNEIEEQLSKDGFNNYILLRKIQVELTKKKIEQRYDCIEIYKKTIKWIKNNTINEESIICNTNLRKGYPEVTGYYIPTLIKWGYRDWAIKYAMWLISIQKENGSWFDTEDKAPYIFDSAQIIKGLIAAREIADDTQKIDLAIKKGCDWIISQMDESGRLITPSTECWGNNENICSEVIHIYCLSPLKDAGVIFKNNGYIRNAEKIWKFYKEKYYEKILNFSLLSHFYAYLMEALLDLEEEDMCRQAMNKMASIQKESGAVPAYNNVDWVCSTGLFQLALVWFRLGEINRGNKAFKYACKLQNSTGGWYGSYLSEENGNEDNNYFPDAEISWAGKYFLDALYYKNKVEFTKQMPDFLASISCEDGRYMLIQDLAGELKPESKIIDVGCGKGRYIKQLKEKYPDKYWYAVVISPDVKIYIEDSEIEIKEGTLTNIPYDDKYFNMLYTCEALEHAIDFEASVREMVRVTKGSGLIVIIDKNAAAYGELEIGEWERWPDEQNLKELLLKYCSSVQIIHGLNYENSRNKELFSAWIGRVK